MGQFLEISKNHKKRKKLPKSLLPIKKTGFLNATFSIDEVKTLLKGTGRIIEDTNEFNEIFSR